MTCLGAAVEHLEHLGAHFEAWDEALSASPDSPSYLTWIGYVERRRPRRSYELSAVGLVDRLS